MLPILPALLLLILQGPSSIERMALDGRLPAALQAVTRQIESQDRCMATPEEAEAAVWASLLAFSGDPELSGALYRLLSLDAREHTTPHKPAPDPGSWADPPSFPSPNLSFLPEAHAECRRSRDGPF